MEVGMLWLDNDTNTPLAIKIAHASEYYRSKYGVVPDLCLVHPSMLTPYPGLELEPTTKVKVCSNRVILPGYLWIGKEDMN
jgi:hypothetical protein